MRYSPVVQQAADAHPDLIKSMKRSPNPRVICLDVGDPDFPTPEHICDAAREAMRQGYTHYVPGAGDKELIGAICDDLNGEYGCVFEPGGVIITAGASGAIYLICRSYLSPGDEVIVFDPSYTNQSYCARLAGAVPVSVPFADGFRLDRDALKNAINSKTRIIFLVNPNNPTGTSLAKEDVEFAARLAVENDLILVSDEVYRKIYHADNTHFCAGSIREAGDHTILVDSFSKTYAMTGWSIGYLATTPELAGPMNIVRMARPGKVNAPAQRAALAALKGPQECVRQMVQEYSRRREAIHQRLSEVEGLSYITPDSAFYFFCHFEADMTSAQMVDYLYEKDVSVRSGTQFGSRGQGWFRLSYCVSYESAVEGIARLSAAIKGLRERAGRPA